MADVQKSAFSLSSATLMIGRAFTDDVFGLRPDKDSVGMVSEAQITLDSSIVELPNGVSQVTVDAKRSGIKAGITANVFEMTAQNFMRAHAMNGVATQVKRGVLSGAVAGGAVSISINSDPIPGEVNSAITANTDIPSGSTILIQRLGSNGQADYVFPTKSTGAATGSAPYVVPLAAPYAVPTGMTFSAGDHVWVVQTIGVGNVDADDLFCVKLTGTLSAYDRPVTYVAPKVRMIQGFNMTYNEDQYSSMPWQMQPLLLSIGEVTANPRLADVGTRQPGLLYVGG